MRRSARTTLVLAVTAVSVIAQFSATASGAVSGGRSPVGHLDIAYQDGVGVHVVGWADDPDTSASATVKLSVDGTRLAAVAAKLSRPDVARVHPSFGASRGYDIKHAVKVGTHKVCTYVVNYPSKVNVLLACRTVTVAINPIGTISKLTQSPGKLAATGWAIDPDVSSTARTVAIKVDNKEVARGLANRPVTGLGKLHLGAGNNHGYLISFAIGEGKHTICAEVFNAGKGTSTNVRCVSHTVNYSPTGVISTLKQVPGGISLTGYASDPDTTAPIDVTVTANGTPLGTVTAADTNVTRPGHGFHAKYLLPGSALTPGNRTICVIGLNAGVNGKNHTVPCITRHFDWNPSVGADTAGQKSPGAKITGWAVDPDTTAPIKVNLLGDGTLLTTVTANGTSSSHPKHGFTGVVPLPDGKHTVCAVAVNTLFGSGNSAAQCKTVTLKFEPYGHADSATRVANSTDIIATGWAYDPDTTSPINVEVSVAGGPPVTALADISRPDVAKAHPGRGSLHGYVVRVPASSGEQKVCVSAVNVLGGSGTTPLSCKIVNAVHPTVATAPTNVGAIAGYGGAQITWTAPTSDGGAPWSSYTITSSPDGVHTSASAAVNAATLLGLKPSTTYSFSVVANNVAGASPRGISPTSTTEKAPPPQTSPAPISTSRYIRNVFGSSSADLAAMRSEGAADAKANPSGHGYLVLLDIGGQDESRGGVILSAGIRFVSYPALVKDVQAYVDGYASQQRPSAPVTIAIGTNNDLDVSRSSGASWANKLVDPVLSYVGRYPGVTIAGANDVEPGFRASYAQTRTWLQGYLASTRAPFVFNGSADGCAWTATNRGCNNGWNMSGLFYLAGGANAVRILNLPQIYNSTMAQQWRYISLTGVQAGQPKINFAGALTEWTACQQAGSCGSLTGVNAWRQMWAQLRAEPRLRPTSLPYSTDLRIDN